MKPKDKSLSKLKGHQKQTLDLLQALNGAMKDPTENIVMGFRTILEHAAQNDLFAGFHKSWEMLLEKGEVDQQYVNTSEGINTLKKVMQTLDNPNIDRRKFEAVQNIFLNTAMMNDEEREDVLVNQYISLALALSVPEILTLSATYTYQLEHDDLADLEIGEWADTISEITGLKHPGWVRRAANSLTEADKVLLIQPTPHLNGYRLTELGYDFCRFIHNPLSNDADE